MSLSDFNVSWFTTVPGLLITGGVILLIFALILLIATGKKSKKEKKAKAEADMLNQQPNMAFSGQQIAGDMASLNQPVMTAPDVNTNPGIVPVSNTAAPVAEAPQMAPMTQDAVMNVMPNQPVAPTPQPAAVSSPLADQPAVTTIVPSAPVVQPQAPTAAQIYGGANPQAVAPVQPQAPTPTQIYGGVDPAVTAQVAPQPATPVAPVAPVAQVAPVGQVPGAVQPVSTIPQQ